MSPSWNRTHFGYVHVGSILCFGWRNLTLLFYQHKTKYNNYEHLYYSREDIKLVYLAQKNTLASRCIPHTAD